MALCLFIISISCGTQVLFSYIKGKPVGKPRQSQLFERGKGELGSKSQCLGCDPNHGENKISQYLHFLLGSFIFRDDYGIYFRRVWRTAADPFRSNAFWMLSGLKCKDVFHLEKALGQVQDSEGRFNLLPHGWEDYLQFNRI